MTNGETYYFRLFLYREIDGVKYYQTSVIKAQTSAMCAIPVPAALKAISATAGDKQVTLSIAYSSTANVSGVEVRYQTGSYPSSATNGSSKTVTGTPTSISITGLANENTYYFRVFPYNEVSGTRYYQTSTTNAQVTGKPAAPVPTVRGITPAKTGSNYIVIDTSGSFTLTIPSGVSATAYMVGGGNPGWSGYDASEDSDGILNEGDGGAGGDGGYYKTQDLSAGTNSCTSAIGSAGKFNSGRLTEGSHTTFKIGSTTYTTSGGTRKNGGKGCMYYTSPKAGSNGFSTPYGYIGSSGGGGGHGGISGKIGGSGAGDGGDGGSERNDKMASAGGNATNYGCGGGGGGGGDCSYSDYDYGASGGAGMKGCIIIGW